MRLFHPLYDWMMRQARGKNAERALFTVSFAESSFFPLPPDIMLIPMCFADRDRAWVLAALTTVGSVLGGLAGYAIGYFMWEAIGQPIVHFYHLEASMQVLGGWYDAYGAWVILLAGFTPIPYKLFTIASGVFAYPLLPFIVLSAISRGARFFLVAGLLYWMGPRLRPHIEARLELITTILALLLVGGFVLVKYLL